MEVPPSLVDALRSAPRVAVLTGAGISAESGLATFRDKMTGLWATYNPMQFATPEAFAADPDLVWGWYEWRRMQAQKAQPNAGHLALAGLQRKLPSLVIITQNVDDLHERAGATDITHLHGSIHAPRCEVCAHPHPVGSQLQEPEAGRRLTPPRCLECGGRVRPGVVWFGEALPRQEWARAEESVRRCQLLVSIGTSGTVEPAASLARFARSQGATTVQVNTDDTALRAVFDHDLRGRASEVLPALAELL